MNNELYNEVNELFDKELEFFNHGFYPFIFTSLVEDRGDFNSLSKNLYAYMLHTVACPFSRVLDIGCGRGKGVDFMSKSVPISNRFVGIDKNQKNIEYAQKNCEGAFILADADKRLPFTDEMFNLVLNIESSHDYSNKKNFFNEVNRILMKGGRLALADNFNDEEYKKTKEAIDESNLEFLCTYDITEQVLASLSIYIKRLLESNLTKEQKEFLIEPLENYKLSYTQGKLKYHSFFMEKS